MIKEEQALAAYQQAVEDNKKAEEEHAQDKENPDAKPDIKELPEEPKRTQE